jgi:hypothetical protein
MKNAKFKSWTALLVLFSVVAFNTGSAKPVDEKVKQFIDSSSEKLKGAVDKIGDNLVDIQNYLDNYDGKGLIQDEASSGAASLKHLQLNGHSRAVVVRPGERVEGVVQCNLDRNKCSALGLYRVVIGISGKGGQTTIGNDLGIAVGESLEKFSLIAPQEAGIYQIRFRVVDKLFEGDALKAWVDKKGNEPDGSTTIGLIIVK